MRPGRPWPLACAALALALALALAGCAVPGTGAGSGGGPAAPIDPPRFPYRAERILPGLGFQQPVYVASPRDGSGRLFVVEKGARILVVPPGDGAAAKVFLDLRDRVFARGGNDERGLLGLAFAPDFAARGRFYVDYTALPAGSPTRISRLTTDPADPDRADPASEQVLLEIPQPYANHNGGMVEIGPDRLLYVALGDGGSRDDPENRAQDPGQLLGKLLRIDPDHPSGERPYGIPADNPYATGGGRPEILALGLRNPWRFSFDRASGALWAGDVGQDHLEEVDLVTRGANFGWRRKEGFDCYQGPDCDGPGLTAPRLDYDHTVGFSITGGYVYRGRRLPELAGTYLFGDFATGRIWGLAPGAGPAPPPGIRVASGYAVRPLARVPFLLSSFGEDEAGELLLVDYQGGGLYRLGAAPGPD